MDSEQAQESAERDQLWASLRALRAETLFLATLARFPKDQEKENVLRNMKAATNRQTVGEDVLWTLINTKEFTLMSGMTLERLRQFGEKVTAAMQKK